MWLNAIYYRHALLHGPSNYCHSLSIVVEQCDLLPIIVATRYSKADQNVTHYRLLSTIIATTHFSSVRSVFSEKQNDRLICRIAAICYFYVALDGQLFLLQPGKHEN